jgi:type II secretory pathway pseudopilin PulG
VQTSGKRQQGFTIAELLIAATITLVIVLLLGTMFGSLTNTASRANQRIDAFRDARAALQLMERDFTGLVKADKTAYFALDKRWQPSGGDPADAYASQGNSGPNQQLFALVSARNKPAGSKPNEIGDLCAVGYYCRWEGNRYTLRRFFRHSIDTYNAIKPQISGITLNYTPASLLYLPARTDDILASYVWNLQVTAYKSDGTKDTTYPLVIDPSNTSVTLPAAIEIQFDAISPAAARTVVATSSNPTDWMDSNSSTYRRLIAPHVYSFRTRIGFN